MNKLSLSICHHLALLLCCCCCPSLVPVVTSSPRRYYLFFGNSLIFEPFPLFSRHFFNYFPTVSSRLSDPFQFFSYDFTIFEPFLRFPLFSSHHHYHYVPYLFSYDFHYYFFIAIFHCFRTIIIIDKRFLSTPPPTFMVMVMAVVVRGVRAAAFP